MAGVPAFNRTEVLLSAAREFADRGYEGASVSHLVAATGLLRGSLYSAFGSKAELFRLAFDAALTQWETDVLVVDLLTVALRERATYDPAVAQLALKASCALDAPEAPTSERIYSRLLTRAGLAPDASI